MPILNSMCILLQKGARFVLFTSLFSALCAVALCMATEKLLLHGMPPVFSSLHFFIMGCTLVVYNVHYLIKKSTAELSDQYAWVQKNRKWNYAFLILGFLLSIAFVFQMPHAVWQVCMLLALFSFAYSLPILPLKQKHRLKDFGWVKIILLAIVWTSVTAVLPILFWHSSLLQFPFELLIRFVFLFVLCLAFDVRDMEVDLEAGIYTLPNKIGLQNTDTLIRVLLFVFFALALIQYFRFALLLRLIINIVSALLTLIAIRFVRKYPSDYNYILLLDGQMLLNGILLLLI